MTRFSNQQKSLMWDRWQQGDSLREISRLLERPPSSVFKQLRHTGGMRPTERSRSSRALSLDERELISRGLASGQSLRAIARELDRAPSTVSREIARNGGSVRCRATTADQATWSRAKRPKECRLASEPKLTRLIAGKLKRFWSPQQIAGWLKRRYPDNERLRMSHETIYKTLYIKFAAP